MKNWEEVYESYKNGDMKEHYEQLQEKLNAKTLNAEEYKEYQKMTKVMGNLPKVENIMTYRDKLESDFEILKEEYVNSRDLEEKLDKEDKNLNKSIEKNLQKRETILEEKKSINKRVHEIDEQLKNEKETLTDEEKEKLQKEKDNLNTKKVRLDTKLSDLSKEVDENNKEFSKNVKTANNIEKREELKGLTKAQIRSKCFKTASLISKCNFVAGKLLEGQSRESLEIALKDWKDRKFTAKTPIPLTRKERKKEETVKEKLIEEKPIEEKPIEEQSTKREQVDERLSFEEPRDEEYNDEDEGLVEVSEFEKRFPRISRFLPKFFKKSKLATSIANLNKDKHEDKEEEKDKVEKPENKENENKENTKQNLEDKKQKFRDYVKYDIDILEVADKGIDQIDAERRKQKLENAKKQAYERDAKKYGYDNPKKDEGR